MLRKSIINDPDMGEVTRFRETEPFEVDGITYHPPQQKWFPMFELRDPMESPVWREIGHHYEPEEEKEESDI